MAPTMFLLLLALCAVSFNQKFAHSERVSQAQRVSGKQRGEACVCPFNSSAWVFPTLKYERVQGAVEGCEEAIENQENQVMLSSERLPQMQALLQNLSARLEPYLYLRKAGLHSALWLSTLGQELKKLEGDISLLHSQGESKETKTLSAEASQLRIDVEKMYHFDIINMKTIKEKLRYLKNRAESCRSFPKDFHGKYSHCTTKGLISNISSPVVTKISPFGKSLISGSWGKQAAQGSSRDRESYWVQPLVNANNWGNTLRLYPSYEKFMASAGHRDVTFAPTHTHKDANQGPNGVLYGDAFYYHCYHTADVCRYNLTSGTVARVTLPGDVGFNNKFPYCYYDCRPYSDVDLEADETGVWAIYATMGSHGNLVVSRLEWDGAALNVTHTWETHVFKKAVSNAFVACGVLYATRYTDESKEEVFYAFDTGTGVEDHALALPLEKVAKGAASVSYNPVDRQIYMYNDGYLLAYQAVF
ncbi:olfactomedin [Gadus morhua]|uniref:Olfactomedin 4-like 2 n=1 Tax=Gadus morhua TaxID=8049 RepID=A0A8C5BE37_GADMO|nr:olfactomedin-like [Gadus morhua]